MASTLSHYISSFVLLIYISSTYAARIINRPPRIITEPEESYNCKDCEKGDHVIVYFKEGEASELTCVADGLPAPEYEWRKNGFPIDFDDPMYISQKTNKTRIVQLGGVGTLQFTETITSDAGIYQCYAKNNLGTALSLKVDLIKAVNMIFPSVTRPEKVERVLGHSLTLNCDVPLSIPKATVFWTTDKTSPDTFVKVQQSERIIQDYDGNLHFANVEKADEKESKAYVCNTYHNTFRTYSQGEDKIIVTSGEKELSQSLEPSIMWISPNDNQRLGLEGEEVKFLCIFEGNPTPDITWSRVKGSLDHARMEVSKYGHELKISSIQGSDEGVYECKGENKLGFKTVTFTLRVDTKPYWLNPPTDQEVGVQESATFQCVAEGKPQPSVQWFVNGKPFSGLKLDETRIRLSTNNQLTYTNLKEKDTCVIQCLAANEHGGIWADFYLNVLALEPEITREPGRMKVAVDQKVTLICENNGKPDPRLTWRKKAQILSGSRYEQKGNTLIIKRVRKTDEGDYQCVAENVYGTETGSGHLTVRKKTKITNRPLGGPIRYGMPYTFQCNAVTDPEENGNLTIYWLKDGVRIDPSTDPNIRQTTYQLKILQTSSADSGTYTCVATNNIDEARAEADLEVEAPPDPPNLFMLECAGNKVRLRWRGARENFSRITKYILEQKMHFDPPQDWQVLEETSGGIGELKIDLSPWVNYTFRIKAVNGFGEGQPSASTKAVCSTNPDIPKYHPENVKFIEDKTNYLITEWDAMPLWDHNAQGFHYILEVQKSGDSKKDKYIINDYLETRKEIQTDDIYQPYEVSVKAENSQGTPIAPPLIYRGHSGMAAPVVSPENFEVNPDINMTYDVAGFRWDAVDTSPEKIRGHFEGYEIQYWKTEEPEKKKTVVVNNDKYLNKKKRDAEKKVEAYVQSLPPYTSLQLHVVAKNTYFASPPSNVIEITTPEGVPGPVRNLRATRKGVDFFQLTWDAPLKPNGKIKDYEVWYEKIIGLDFIERKTSDSDIVETYTESNTFDSLVNGLEETTQYRIHVFGKTETGDGEDIYIDVTTSPPGDPAVPVVAGITAFTNYLNVSWSHDPNQIRSGLDHFVEYRKQGEKDFSEMPPERIKTWQIVPNLTAGEVYEVRVVANSSGGFKRSELHSKTTLGGPGALSPAVYEHTWFIIMMISLAILILIFIIVCLVKRSRGDKYHVQEKEKLRGLDPDDKKSAHINEFNDNGEKQPLARDSDPDLEKGALDSEQDSLEEYGDVDPSRFNEDGSFIGQYGAQNPSDTTQPSAMHTFV